MRFMLLMFPHGNRDCAASAGGRPMAEVAAAMSRYNEALRKAGVLLAIDGLAPLSTKGARLSFGNGKVQVIDGAVATRSEDALVAYWMIQAKSKEEAVAWAARCPAGDSDVIEVRQVEEMGDLPLDVQQALRGGGSSSHCAT